MDRSSKMKINKEAQALNDTLNKMDLTAQKWMDDLNRHSPKKIYRLPTNT